jgi:putative heme-binding domain-containing protein
MGKKPDVVQRRGHRYWPSECLHLVQQLLIRDPALADALMEHEDFVAPANLELVPLFTAASQEAATRKFMAAVRQNSAYPWSEDLVRLLGTLPPGEAAPVLRPQWRLAPLREEVVRVLARSPGVLDREKYLWGLGADDLDVVRSCLDALLSLPKIGSPTALAAGARLLDRLLDDPRHFVLRAQALRWFEREAGQTFEVHEQGTSPEGLRQAYRPIFHWLAQTQPAIGRPLEPAGEVPPWRQRIQAASRMRGNPSRGEVLFRQHRCLECHHGPAAFGPDLSAVLRGVTSEEMFRSVLFPDEQVRPGYRLTRFRARQGPEAQGVVIWESALGGLFNIGPNETIRFSWKDIADAQLLDLSPMPKNLTGGMSTRDLADLQAFLVGLAH